MRSVYRSFKCLAACHSCSFQSKNSSLPSSGKKCIHFALWMLTISNRVSHEVDPYSLFFFFGEYSRIFSRQNWWLIIICDRHKSSSIKRLAKSVACARWIFCYSFGWCPREMTSNEYNAKSFARSSRSIDS